MRVRPESVTHLVVKLFNVKSKFDYIDTGEGTVQKETVMNHRHHSYHSISDIITLTILSVTLIYILLMVYLFTVSYD